jgi:hypothetical protein
MDILEIEARAKNPKGKLTDAERAFLIANNIHAFWAFLIGNNPGNINDTLMHQMGYDYLTFEPNKKAMGNIIEKMIEKNETDNLNKILSAFKFNPNVTISETLKRELLNRFKQ